MLALLSGAADAFCALGEELLDVDEPGAFWALAAAGELRSLEAEARGHE